MPIAPSPWVSPEDVETRLTAAGVTVATLVPDAPQLVQAATDFLFERSGRRFNVNTWEGVRPQRVRSECGCWANAWQDGPERSFYCPCVASEVLLKPLPVQRITEVKVDGVVLASTAYALYDDERLVRMDGSGWPCCQSLSRAATETGTWSVSYVAGDQPPELGVIAALELAYQLGLYFSGGGGCAIPPGQVVVSRQGVTFSNVSGALTVLGVSEFLTAFPPRPRASFIGADQVRLRRPT